MKNARFLLALAPLVAIWFYAVGQSLGQMQVLMMDVPAAVERPAAAPLDAALREAPAAARVPEVETAAAPRPSPSAPSRDAAPLPDRVAAAAPAPHVIYTDPQEDAEPLRHPDITDPKMRKLLQPAWDD